MPMSSYSPFGNRDVGALLRDGKRADAPTGVEVRPEPWPMPIVLPDGMPVDEPTPVGTGPGRRMSCDCGDSGVTADLDAPAPAAQAAAPNEPNIAPQAYSDMTYKELHTLRKRRGARSLLITRPLAKYQNENAHSATQKPSPPMWKNAPFAAASQIRFCD